MSLGGMDRKPKPLTRARIPARMAPRSRCIHRREIRHIFALENSQESATFHIHNSEGHILGKLIAEIRGW
ncbi:MAG: hypothetical protein C0404_05095 [Verrucomicrobia bacterium]|nr:hypothetical protein [Verrucomicrobiota bacterium]